ncbi:hypothetical protein DFH07DRAFT_741313 [Mycena maculata]|uniref:Large ribosomal subunit protein eL20 domain-containing protein n=1 Tax=Mycena maculata TaxID=230809 RepID=A0AAD7NEQ6_9AGAR|nr:hypothetical protein DFH07DRAFT_741313 [Mycena maculata]
MYHRPQCSIHSSSQFSALKFRLPPSRGSDITAVWLRYDSRLGTHNMYKEFRDLSRADAVKSLYQDIRPFDLYMYHRPQCSIRSSSQFSALKFRLPPSRGSDITAVWLQYNLRLGTHNMYKPQPLACGRRQEPLPGHGHLPPRPLSRGSDITAVWLRYDSRSGTHNMYKEFRDLYQDMAVNLPFCHLNFVLRRLEEATSPLSPHFPSPFSRVDAVKSFYQDMAINLPFAT